MADLRPLGSEKLQGVDKLKRIIEIATYNDKRVAPVNENKNSDYSIRLADGNTYHIVKERNGYIIKHNITESVIGYIEPIEERKYYESYSKALNRLNIIAKELNSLYGNNEGTSLFYEQKRYTLKTPKPKMPMDDVENVPLPADPGMDAQAPPPPPPPDMGGMDQSGMGAGAPPPPPPPMGGDASGAPEAVKIPTPSDDEFGGYDNEEDFDFGGEGSADEFDFGGEDEGEEGYGNVTFKTIEKLTGKLSQKLRSYGDDNEMTSKDIKYVVNSILSAVDLSILDEEDLDDIMSKFDMEPEGEFDSDEFGGYEDEESEPNEFDFEDQSYDGGYGEPMGDMPPPPPPPGGSMPPSLGESTWGDFADDVVKNTALKYMNKKAINNESKYLTDNLVENTLSSYFMESVDERRYNKKVLQDRYSSVLKEINKFSENDLQRESATKFAFRNSDAKLIGKSNKNNLIFELNGSQYKITPKGSVL